MVCFEYQPDTVLKETKTMLALLTTRPNSTEIQMQQLDKIFLSATLQKANKADCEIHKCIFLTSDTERN